MKNLNSKIMMHVVGSNYTEPYFDYILGKIDKNKLAILETFELPHHYGFMNYLSRVGYDHAVLREGYDKLVRLHDHVLATIIGDLWSASVTKKYDMFNIFPATKNINLTAIRFIERFDSSVSSSQLVEDTLNILRDMLIKYPNRGGCILEIEYETDVPRWEYETQKLCKEAGQSNYIELNLRSDGMYYGNDLLIPLDVIKLDTSLRSTELPSTDECPYDFSLIGPNLSPSNFLLMFKSKNNAGSK